MIASILYLDVRKAFDDLAQLLFLKHRSMRQSSEKVTITLLLSNLTTFFFRISVSIRFIDQDESSKTLIAALDVANRDMREASDPRDHYFGILGLVPLTSTESQQLRSLSYKNSTVDIYKAVAHVLYEKHGLEILGYCYAIPSETSLHGGNEKTAPVLSLPSWVPNWAGGWIVPLQQRLSVRSANCYRASSFRSQTSSARFAIDGGSLKVKGIVLDRIRILKPFWDDSQGGLPRSETMSRFWAPWISAILDLLGDSDVYADQRARLHAIFRTSIADCVHDIAALGGLRRTNSDHRTLFDELASEYQSIIAEDPEWHASIPGVDDYIDLLCRFLSRHWKLLITDKGHLGLGRRTCRSGDVVCVLHSASTPHILRPVVSNEEVQTSTLVGEAYIHGFMDGECVPAASDTRIFTLV